MLQYVINVLVGQLSNKLRSYFEYAIRLGETPERDTGQARPNLTCGLTDPPPPLTISCKFKFVITKCAIHIFGTQCADELQVGGGCPLGS